MVRTVYGVSMLVLEISKQVYYDPDIFEGAYVSQFLRWAGEGRVFFSPTAWGYAPNEVKDVELKAGTDVPFAPGRKGKRFISL